jgi:hypothetical protein
MSQPLNSSDTAEDIHRKGKVESKEIQNAIDSDQKDTLYASLNTSSDTFKKVSGRSMFNDSEVIQPVKSDDGWTSTESERKEGAIAILDTKEYKPQDNLSEVVNDIEDEYSEYFENAPHSMRVHVEGEGTDASISVGVYDSNKEYAQYIAGETGNKVYDTQDLSELDSIDSTGYDKGVYDTVTESIEVENKKDYAKKTGVNVEEGGDTIIENMNELYKKDMASMDEGDTTVDDITDGIPQERIDEALATANGENVYRVGDESRTVPSVDGEEEIEITSSTVCRNAVVKVDEQTGINIRAGANLPADIPTDPDNVKEYISAMYKQDEKFRSLNFKQNFIDLSQIEDDLTWDDDIDRETYTKEMTNLTDEEAKSLMDTVGDGNVSDMSESELEDLLGENKGKEASKYSNIIDMAKGGEKAIDLPSVGVGGSIGAYYGSCNKGCANCGSHGPYKKRGYRNSMGVSTSEYIGKP